MENAILHNSWVYDPENMHSASDTDLYGQLVTSLSQEEIAVHVYIPVENLRICQECVWHHLVVHSVLIKPVVYQAYGC